MDQQLVNSISDLQDREKKLHSDFHGNSPELKRQSLKEMEELTRLRVQMFTALKSQYTQDVAKSKSALDDQVATLHIVENELNKAQSELRALKKEYVDKMRMVEISTYFSEKYRAYNSLFKLVLMWAIPLGVLIYVGMRNPVPEAYVSKNNSNTVFLTLFMVLGFVALFQILVKAYDLSKRNNMNFNEYDFGSDLDLHKRVDHSGALPPDDGMGVVAHDEMVFKKLAGKMNLGCVDSSCCADGTMYDDVKKRCIPSMKRHENNTHKASLSKGAMSSAQEVVKHLGSDVDSYSKDIVPFSSV